MPLDRQSIEKRDFPIGRRGYDPDAVDAHLRAVAGEVEGIERGAGTPAESLASSASEQVRQIVEAAETTAENIRREADQDARRMREDAAEYAQRARDEATAEARERVEAVSEAVRGMLQRVDAMEGELGALVETVRTGGNRLTADLALLQGSLGDLGEAAGRPAERREASGANGGGEEPAASTPAEPEVVVVEEVIVVAESEPVAEHEEAGASEPAADDDDDVEGARLIALNMALNGSSRDETDRYLAENFELANRDSLLDDVYTRVGG